MCYCSVLICTKTLTIVLLSLQTFTPIKQKSESGSESGVITQTNVWACSSLDQWRGKDTEGQRDRESRGVKDNESRE